MPSVQYPLRHLFYPQDGNTSVTPSVLLDIFEKRSKTREIPVFENEDFDKPIFQAFLSGYNFPQDGTELSQFTINISFSRLTPSIFLTKYTTGGLILIYPTNETSLAIAAASLYTRDF